MKRRREEPGVKRKNVLVTAPSFYSGVVSSFLTEVAEDRLEIIQVPTGAAVLEMDLNQIDALVTCPMLEDGMGGQLLLRYAEKLNHRMKTVLFAPNTEGLDGQANHVVAWNKDDTNRNIHIATTVMKALRLQPKVLLVMDDNSDLVRWMETIAKTNASVWAYARSNQAIIESVKQGRTYDYALISTGSNGTVDPVSRPLLATALKPAITNGIYVAGEGDSDELHKLVRLGCVPLTGHYEPAAMERLLWIPRI